MSKLLLRKDGSLMRTKEIYDEEKNCWNSSEYDVADHSWHYLNDDIEFEDGITLKDFFSLINKNLDIYVGIFGNWIDEYTDVILNGIPEEQDDDSDSIDYLNVYWRVDVDNDYFEIPAWPEFGGVGIAKKETHGHKVGDVVKWAVGYSPMQNYSHLPLQLEKKVILCENNSKLKEYKSNEYTLYQVIQGIVWEISFHGSPKDTAKFVEGLKETAQKFENGEEDCISLDEFLERFDIDDVDKEIIPLPKFTFEDVLNEYKTIE